MYCMNVCMYECMHACMFACDLHNIVLRVCVYVCNSWCLITIEYIAFAVACIKISPSGQMVFKDIHNEHPLFVQSPSF